MQTFKADDPINQVLLGVKKFQNEKYPDKKKLFQSLAKGQQPKILFVTCSDSRIDASLITQTDPGSMFLIQNAGNIVPPYGTPYGGTGASIEYAVSVLGVQHIIVCGHSFCGAMGAVLDQSNLDSLPSVKQWVSYAEAARALVQAEGLSEGEQLPRCIERNVQVQIQHLKTLPSVVSRLSQGKLSLHGWVYQIETGDIDVLDPQSDTFMPFDKAYSIPASVAAV